MVNEFVRAPEIAILPHKDAPAFQSFDEAQRTIEDMISEMNSENVNPGKELIDLIRQASLVNLWFFLKYVASVSGPYDKLTPTLHLDMCNFRQSRYCMEPGARVGIILPRGHYKTTIFTHGSATWELIRDPDLTIRFANAIIGRAHTFKSITQRNFDSNPLIKYLWPEHCPPEQIPQNSHIVWNNEEFILPSRMKKATSQPSIKAGGATGSSEGDHHHLLNIDDIAGLDDIDSDRRANAAMDQKKKWFNTSTEALLISPETGRIIAAFTRYAADDVYAPVFNNMGKVFGYRDPDLVKYEREGGKWSIYFRDFIEDGEIIFPEEFSKDWYESLLRTDRWTALTQYRNKPVDPTSAELRDFDPGYFTMRDDERVGKMIVKHREPQGPGIEKSIEDNEIPLSTCHVIMAIDPASGLTHRKSSAVSIGVWAMDSKGDAYRIWGKYGALAPRAMVEAIFEGHKEFRGYISKTVVESNAMQRIIPLLLEWEQSRRGQLIRPVGVPSSTDKVVTIRDVVGGYLARGGIWLRTGYSSDFIDEQQIFPSSLYKLDCLDETVKALQNLIRPLGDEEFEEDEEANLWAEEAGRYSAVGY